MADITKYKEAECCDKWQDFASSHFQYKKEKSGMIPNLLADITKYKGSECCGKWQDFVIFTIKKSYSYLVKYSIIFFAKHAESHLYMW